MLSFFKKIFPKNVKEPFVLKECKEQVITATRTEQASSFISDWKIQNQTTQKPKIPARVNRTKEKYSQPWHHSDDPFCIKINVLPVPSSLMNDAHLRFIAYSKIDGYPIFKFLGGDINRLTKKYEIEELSVLSSMLPISPRDRSVL